MKTTSKNKSIFIVVGCIALSIACALRPRTIQFLDHQNAGDAAFIKSDYAEAEKHYKAALTIAETEGPDNALVQIALHYLGINYLAQKKYVEAEAAYLRQIEVAEKVYGAQSPDLLSPLSDITLLFLNQKRFDDAQKYNERALFISNKILAGQHKEGVALTESLRDLIKKFKST